VPRTRYYTATSVDGFIADAHNNLEWLIKQPRRDSERFEGFLAEVGALIMGANTYQWILNAGEDRFWHDYYGDRPCWVFTHRELPGILGADVQFVRGDVRPVHRDAVTGACGRDLWLVGGGELVGKFADADLLDQVLLGVAPVTLGEGAPLLPRRLVGRLELTGVARNGGFAELTYAVHPAGARHGSSSN
jgi:dihydrofolate reductase